MRNVFLPGRFKPGGLASPQPSVFRCPALYPFPPHFPAAELHLLFHDADNLRLFYTKLILDGIKGRSVLPSHFYNPVDIPVC